MAKNKETTYWPHMIIGFLIMGFTLSYWTVKSASSMPVQESNNYMLKYQTADIHINDILKAKQAFDKQYSIHLENAQKMVMIDNINSNRPQKNAVVLRKGKNDFLFSVKSKTGEVIKDAKVTFLLTQPHSRKEDQLISKIAYTDKGYSVNAVEITKAGRYSLQFRAEVGDSIGYFDAPAYLKPQK